MITDEDIVVCPECEHEQTITICPSVNVTTDPEMREKVLTGDLFLFTCDNCGFSGFAGYPFIYEDKETNGGFLIYLEPDCEDREVGIEGDIADQVIYREKPMRLVSDVNSLKEKVFIFEAGLDDRVVELFKVLTLMKMQDDDPANIPDELRFTKVDVVDDEKMIIFAAFREDKFLGSLEMPYSLYQSCVITGGPIWDVPITECTAIDRQWILDRLKMESEAEHEESCECSECRDHHDCGEEHKHSPD